jgi:hypothetical protein
MDGMSDRAASRSGGELGRQGDLDRQHHPARVPQVGGYYQLLFCSARPSARRLAELGDVARRGSTHYFIGSSPAGPFALAPVTVSESGQLHVDTAALWPSDA